MRRSAHHFCEAKYHLKNIICAATSFIYSVLPVSYTHLRAHETDSYLVCRLLLEKKKKTKTNKDNKKNKTKNKHIAVMNKEKTQ